MRKGQAGPERLIYYVMFELFMLGVLALALYMYVYGEVGDSTFWKNYYARDNALLLDTLPAADGNVHFTYDQVRYIESDSFRFTFLPNKVIIADEEDYEETQAKWFPYGMKTGLIYNLPEPFIPYKYYFDKNRDTITVSKAITETGCSEINTAADITKQTFTFVTSHEETALLLKQYVKTRLELFGGVPRSNLDVSDGNVTIGFAVADENALYYVETNNLFEHQKFACLLGNRWSVTNRPVQTYEQFQLKIPGVENVFVSDLAFFVTVNDDDWTSVDIQNTADNIYGSLVEYYS